MEKECSSLWSKIKKCLSLIKHKSFYAGATTYYPGCERKSMARIIKDQMRFVWKYGFVEEYYFTYGFDRKEMTPRRMADYIVPYRTFLNLINELNFQNPYYDEFNGRMTCRVINQDKFYFYLFLSRIGIPTPKVYCFLKNGHILYVDDIFSVNKILAPKEQLRQMLSHDMDAFAKPAEGMMGKGVFRLQVKGQVAYVNGKKHNVDDLIDIMLSADYLIQETIVQHEALSKLCGSSVNTIRLQTVMDKNGEVVPFGAMIRIGREGSSVDNWAKGGVIVGIDEDGRLKRTGFLKPRYGTTTKEHPDSRVEFDGFEVPFYKKAVSMAVELHKVMYRSHSIGWDIAITSNGPVFIEGNDRWEMSMVQAVHGGMRHLMKYFDVDTK